MSEPASNRITVTYRLDAANAPGRAVGDWLRARAEALALEQSLEMPLSGVTSSRIREQVAGQVLAVRQTDEHGGEADLGLSIDTFGTDAGQLLNMLFGNCSLQPDVGLLEVDFPAHWQALWPGPAFGLDGLRAAVGAGPGELLGCSALKPQGLSSEALATLAGQLAAAGIDVIKDDHGIADQASAPFAERVPRVQQAIDAANGRRVDGRRTIYAPTLCGDPLQVLEQLALIDAHGVGAALACPMLMGVAMFSRQVCARGQVPVLAHPAFAGSARIAPALLLGKLFRLLGADASIFPYAGGRFSFGAPTCDAIVHALRAPDGSLAPAMPVPAGGMTQARVPEMIRRHGHDQMLLIGGYLLEDPAQLPARARAFMQAVRDG
ncbi:MAG: RuBisCO large subunit C-terminal-like domain-containing protein [Burkholderiaceae bacterium]